MHSLAARAEAAHGAEQLDISGRSERWAARSRAGRQALRSGSYAAAETNFAASLEGLSGCPAHDARIHATLGNLVTLAAIYGRLQRAEDAQRVMSLVRRHTESPGMTRSADPRYEARYRSLLQQPFGLAGAPLSASQVPVARSLDTLIVRTARSYGVSPALVKAVVAAESNFDSEAVSRAGAQGLMQLMPETAREMGVQSPLRPKENLNGGVRYLRKMIDRYGNLSHALAAYNAGPQAVDRYGGIPPYPETQDYVERVLDFYRDYQRQFSN